MQHMHPVAAELYSPVTKNFSLETISLMVHAKMLRRAEKQIPFLCYVLDANETPDEFEIFLRSLQHIRHKLPERFRFQVICARSCNFVAADFEIVNGQIDVILFSNIRTLQYALPTMQSILKCCPEAAVKFFRVSLQVERHNCASFAIDTVYRAAKIDDFHAKTMPYVVEQSGNNFPDIVNEELSMVPGFYAGINREQVLVEIQNVREIYMPSEVMPPEFGPLFRNTQSLPVLQQNYFGQGLFGSDTKSLEQYVGGATQNHRNMAIDLKREKLKAKARQFARQHGYDGLTDRCGVRLFSQYMDNPSQIQDTLTLLSTLSLTSQQP